MNSMAECMPLDCGKLFFPMLNSQRFNDYFNYSTYKNIYFKTDSFSPYSCNGNYRNTLQSDYSGKQSL